MDKKIKNTAASVHQRLLKKARKSSRPFNELLQHFAIERFIYRLSKSPHADRFVLKGALMFLAWTGSVSRPTMDIDLLGKIDNNLEVIIAVIKDACEMEVESDGIVFHKETVTATRITEDADYKGVRVFLRGSLSSTRLFLQIDIGFGDVIFPGPDKVKYPVLLFKGRDDVYAKRWENKSKSTSGYSPVCLNQWQIGVCGKPKISCSKCEHKLYAVLNEDIIEKHLRGDIVVGIYPMLPDETCYFLTMDFDEADWQKDISVLRDVCIEFNIPVAIERSRSGKGGHVWFFFENRLAAALARKFGTALLTRSMSRRHEILFKLYDRLFPSQDTLPKGGLGNLIALPLQKAAREKTNSEFIDENFQSYGDQWAFLKQKSLCLPRGCETELSYELEEFGIDVRFIDNWENENVVTLFMERLNIFKTPSHQHSYYHILESIFPCRPNIVCKVFWDDLNKKLDHMLSLEDFEKRNFCGYHDIKLFKKIYDWDDEHAFIGGLKIIYRLVEITKGKNRTPFYHDKSFYVFDDSTGWDQPREDFFKGGVVEHSRAFGEKVFKKPDEFYDFVFTLGKRSDISISYLTEGMDGLVRAKYDLEKIKILIKEYWKNKNTEFRKIVIKALSSGNLKHLFYFSYLISVPLFITDQN